MYALGAAFRDQYVRLSRLDEHVGIVGIRAMTIDNSQLFIQASTDHCSAASAIAFMQGLYPPFPRISCDRTVPEHSRLANDSIVNYPMFGYQYPIIRTSDPDLDPDSIWSHGFARCKKHETSLLMFPSDGLADAMHHASQSFYGRLWGKVFQDAFPRSEATFFNANELYEYAVYRWTHDPNAHSAMTLGDLERLQELAWQEQTLKYASTPGSDKSHDDLASTMAGRTLVSRVAALFAENIASQGERNKLNLAFTSHEPFLSFFALSGLLSGPSSHLFSQMPVPGATLTFELFSVDSDETADDESSSDSDGESGEDATNHACSPDHTEICVEDDTCGAPELCNNNDYSAYVAGSPTSNNSSSSPLVRRSFAYPPADKLYVRFLYRNGTSDPKTPPVPCPLFSNSRTSMSFRHFNETAWSVGIANATAWCGVCESDAFFCKGAEERQQPHHRLAAFIGASSSAVLLLLLHMVL